MEVSEKYTLHSKLLTWFYHPAVHVKLHCTDALDDVLCMIFIKHADKKHDKIQISAMGANLHELETNIQQALRENIVMTKDNLVVPLLRIDPYDEFAANIIEALRQIKDPIQSYVHIPSHMMPKLY